MGVVSKNDTGDRITPRHSTSWRCFDDLTAWIVDTSARVRYEATREKHSIAYTDGYHGPV